MIRQTCIQNQVIIQELFLTIAGLKNMILKISRKIITSQSGAVFDSQAVGESVF